MRTGARSFGVFGDRNASARLAMARGHGAALLGVANQGEEAVDAVDELAIGHGDEQRQHDAEMEREQEAIARFVASASNARPVSLSGTA